MPEDAANGEYFKWIALKTKIIKGEKAYTIPDEALPTIINEYVFNYLYPDKQQIIEKYYKYEKENKRYVLNAKKSSIISEDKDTIVHSCILKRGMVVWVEFGYNIGCEFGGKHPALILRNCKDALIVAPLSSQKPTETAEKYSVKIDKVYNFPLKERWTNVLRIQPISVQRIDFKSKFGSVKNEILNDISKTISKYGIK